MPMQEQITRAAQMIRDADALLITAGAGMGVDSGLPDFRGKDGFWNAYPALGNAGLDFRDVASPYLLRRDPALGWGFYGHRLKLYRETQPHAGFALLQAWARRMKRGAFVVTSNVDGQFQKAGYAPERVCEIHGSLHHLQCDRNCTGLIWSADEFSPQVDEVNCRLLNEPPRCGRCGELARPNVLMFDDWNWISERTDAQRRRWNDWLKGVQRPVVIELGAGLAIPSIRHITARVCNTTGAQAIRINPVAPEIDLRMGVGLQIGALAALQAIAQALGEAWRLSFRLGARGGEA